MTVVLAMLVLSPLVCGIVAFVADIFEAEARANHELLLDELWGDE